MGAGWWLALVAALLFFWAIGAYNRLVRLRKAATRAFAALAAQLVRQLVWVQGCLPEPMRGGPLTMPGELQDEVTVVWARLQAASEQLAVALAQARRLGAVAPVGPRQADLLRKTVEICRAMELNEEADAAWLRLEAEFPYSEAAALLQDEPPTGQASGGSP